jgi:hypothetical protein
MALLTAAVAALRGLPWYGVAAALLAALAAHLFDLKQHWK